MREGGEAEDEGVGAKDAPASLGYHAWRGEGVDLALPAFRLELGHVGRPSEDSKPDLAIATGGQHSPGALFVFEQSPKIDIGVGFRTLHEGDHVPRSWAEAKLHFFSQVHFADIRDEPSDGRSCEGPELLASVYAELALPTGLFAWCLDKRGPTSAVRLHEVADLKGTEGGIEDFDVIDLEGDGSPKLAVAYRRKKPKRSTTKISDMGPSLRVGPTEPEWLRGVQFGGLNGGDTQRYLEVEQRGKRSEVSGVSFFDIDGDGWPELLARASGEAVVVMDGRALLAGELDGLESCKDEREGFWCAPTQATVVGLEAFVCPDHERGEASSSCPPNAVMLVAALDSHVHHDGCPECEGAIRRFVFERHAPLAQGRELDSIAYLGPGTLLGLELIEGTEGRPLAVVSHGDYGLLLEGRGAGGLRAHSLLSTREPWLDLTDDPCNQPRVPLDIEAIASAEPREATLSAPLYGPHSTLPGPGPHSIEAVRVGGKHEGECKDEGLEPWPRCAKLASRDCWALEPRANAIVLRARGERPECHAIDFASHPSPLLAVADNWQWLYGGAWFYNPPNYPSGEPLTNDVNETGLRAPIHDEVNQCRGTKSE